MVMLQGQSREWKGGVSVEKNCIPSQERAYVRVGKLEKTELEEGWLWWRDGMGTWGRWYC